MQTLPTRARYKVFANIPFAATSDIVRRLYLSSNPPRDCYLVLQKEAADRFQGLPRETLFSLLLKPWFKTAVIHRFERADFCPVPRVDVVFLRTTRNEPPAIPWQLSESWRDFIAFAFGRGKVSLRKALDKVITYHQFRRLSIEVDFGVNAKPTGLGFEQWLALFRFFTKYAGPSNKKCTHKAFLRLTEQQLLLSKQHRTHVR
jgi:23S rRNA (adenine-N6)-dimethyltransferase